jgi:DNA (cytosine-5)-methyltransferase 1
MLCIELFAGCGGLALGLHRAGCDGLFAIERDPMAFETFEHNFLQKGAPFASFKKWPSWLRKEAHDLEKLLTDATVRTRLRGLRGNVDVVAGGPPCQGFSVGGRRDGLDARNRLVYAMLDFVDLVRPTSVLIENVEGIARKFVSKPGESGSSVADDVIRLLEQKGYEATIQTLDATAFGVPQSRRRVVIFAIQKAKFKSDADFAKKFRAEIKKASVTIKNRYSLPKDRPSNVEEALHDLAGSESIQCPDSPKYESGIYSEPKSAYAKLMRQGLPSQLPPDSHRLTKHGPGILKLYSLAHGTQPAGRLSKSFLLSNGTKKDKKVLLGPKCVASTITTHPDAYIHYVHSRNITVREMARLQSFPDVFKFRGRYTINGPRRRFDVARCSQVGNAVPPLLAEGIGIAVINTLKACVTKTPAPRKEKKSGNSQLALPLVA